MSEESKDPPLSKNQLKKLKREQVWEENRANRKIRRKEKVQERKQRKRVARDEANLVPSPEKSNAEPLGEEKQNGLFQRSKPSQSVQLPITIVFDCGFDDLMMDKERKSLGSQLTRCYSDNHKAPYQAHLAVSSFGGHLKERFDGILAGQHYSWKNVRFIDGDFIEAATQAKRWMREDQGGRLAGMFATKEQPEDTTVNRNQQDGDVVYLTSDSPETLTALRPYCTYIIGGLVDKNRHKGICYKQAKDRGIMTAKLPIGDYMQMTSRFVLTTNHVAEIMLRWLELGDWGKAFLRVVPKRKGGVLREGLDCVNDEGTKADGEGVEEADERSPRSGSTALHYAESATLASDATNEKQENTEKDIRNRGSSDCQRGPEQM